MLRKDIVNDRFKNKKSKYWEFLATRPILTRSEHLFLKRNSKTLNTFYLKVVSYNLHSAVDLCTVRKEVAVTQREQRLRTTYVFCGFNARL